MTVYERQSIGLRMDSRITSPCILESPPPTSIVAPRDVVDDSKNKDGGVWGCRARAAVMRRFGGGSANTPTAIFGDNEAVINIAITGMGYCMSVLYVLSSL